MSEDSYSPPSEPEEQQSSFYVLSGCSGSGKSSLLAELAGRGYETVAEAGRQIVKEQLRIGGDALPWENGARFAELAVSRSMYQFNVHRSSHRPVFFDRSIVDIVSGYSAALGTPTPEHLLNAVRAYRYARTVFMSPPWKEIYRNDNERRHSFENAVAEYDGLLPGYRRFGYETVEVPRMSVSERADFILDALA